MKKNIFVKTKNVKAFISMVTKLKQTPKNLPRMGLVYGEPGLGKTHAIVWLMLKQNAVVVTAKNGMTTRWFLSELVSELGETPSFHVSALFEQATIKLIEKPKILIVDEIDYLVNESRTIETIRDLHDKTGIPILLVGMGSVDKKLRRYHHLFDRIVEIYRFLPFDEEDVREIVKTLADVEIDDEVISLIYKKGNRFRQIVKQIAKIEEIAITNECKIIRKEDLGW